MQKYIQDLKSKSRALEKSKSATEKKLEKETSNSSKIQKELNTYKTKNGEINKELSRLKEFESLYSKLSKDNSKLLGEVAKIGNIILENEMLRGQITSLK